MTEQGRGAQVVPVRTTESDGVAVVHVAGEVDLATHEVIRNGVHGALELRPGALVLDLSGVTFLASVGISLLVELRQYAEQHGIGFAVVAERRSVLRPLTATGVVDVLTLRPTLADAVAAVRGERDAS
ncbi:STAS domain-containing protein [Actinosynnema sp. NPDC020468]|uniref:STAS domain-containing protein n=1 Tax=Actinosynnema sp. NPDC020468 TaxID=3154488 RepID=UPI003403A568